jgi:hypothetical protein
VALGRRHLGYVGCAFDHLASDPGEQLHEPIDHAQEIGIIAILGVDVAAQQLTLGRLGGPRRRLAKLKLDRGPRPPAAR